MYKYLIVGKIINTHGLKGDLKIVSLSDNIERFKDLKEVYLSKEPLKDDTSCDDIKFNITSVKFQNKLVLIKFDKISDIDMAKKYKDYFISIDRKDAIKLDEGSYFICDLLGCQVYEHGILLGTIIDIIETGSNDVYVVKRESKKDLLIPALKTVVKGISIEERKVEVILPEGLIKDDI